MACTQTRSETCSLLPNIGSISSDIEERRFIRTLEVDVEAPHVVRLDVHACDEMLQQAAGKDDDVDEFGPSRLEPVRADGVGRAASEAFRLPDLDERVVHGISG